MSQMSWRSILLVTLLAGAGSCAAIENFKASDKRTSSTLILCSSKKNRDKGLEDLWRLPLDRQVFRLRDFYAHRGIDLQIGRSSFQLCPNLEESACTVDKLTPHVAYCDSEILSRTLEAAAYMSAAGAAVLTSAELKDESDLRLPIDAFDAYDTVYASRFLPEDRTALAFYRIHQSTGIPIKQMNELGRIVRNIWEDESWGYSFARPNDTVSGVAQTIYETATSAVFAFLMGHEVSHSFTRCPFAQASLVETSGLLKNLVDIHLDRSIFEEQPLSLSEVRADACAIRVMEAVGQDVNARVEDRRTDVSTQQNGQWIAAMGRRIAIEQAGWLLSAGLKAEVNVNTHRLLPLTKIERSLFYFDKPVDGYLRTPFRHLLFAKSLQGITSSAKDFIQTCDGRFEWSMASLMTHCKACSHSKLLSDTRFNTAMPNCDSERSKWRNELSDETVDASVPENDRWPKNADLALSSENRAFPVSHDLFQLVQAITQSDLETAQGILKVSPSLIGAPLPGGQSLLHMAAAGRDDPAVLHLLYDHGARESLDQRGRSPLLTAALSRNINLVRSIAERTRLMNEPDRVGSTPVSIAVHFQDIDMLKILSLAGADINAVDLWGYTPLIAAAMKAWNPGAIWLISHGADVNRVLPDGNAALHFAVLSNNVPLMGALLNVGALPQRRTTIGKVPLHMAAMLGDRSAVIALLDHGADPNIVDLQLNTPLFLASVYGRTEVVKLLIERGVDKSLANVNGSTALLGAIRNNEYSIAAMLVSTETARMADAEGRTPLSELAGKKQSKLESRLRKYGAR